MKKIGPSGGLASKNLLLYVDPSLRNYTHIFPMMLNCAQYFYSKINLKLGETTSQNRILIPGSATLAFHVKPSFSSRDGLLHEKVATKTQQIKCA